MKSRWWMAGATVLALGCAESMPVEPAPDLATAKGGVADATATQTITVMTRNLYVGADVDAIIAAIVGGDPEEILASLVVGYQQLVRTDFPTRAEAIADEILKARPHVVGLQELTRLTLDLTALYPAYLPVEIDYEMEFLPYLQDALADRGLDYDVIVVKNIDLDVAPVPGTTAHLEDWDAMMIRGDLTPTATGGANFTACLGPTTPCLGGPLPIKRGYVWADIPLNGVTVRFVSSHPESGSDPQIAGVRLMQITELMTVLGTASPVVLMGDLNEDPNADLTPYPSVYEVLTGAGFSDVWRSLRPGVVGFTCCHESDLSDAIPSGFDERIDYVLTRGLGRAGPGLQGKITIIGLTPSARVMGPLGMIWPSDHAGLVATLLFPPAWAGTK